MIRTFTGKFFNALVLTLILTMAVPWAAFADTQVFTEAVIASETNAGSTVVAGNNPFQIKVWGDNGAVPKDRTGLAYVVNRYTMSVSSNGTATIAASTDPAHRASLQFTVDYNYSTCPAPVQQGCSAKPFMIDATLFVPEGAVGKSAQLIVNLIEGTNSGISVVNNSEDVEALVVSSNKAPTATAQTVEVAHNTSKLITLAGTDPENNSLTYHIKSLPSSGRLYKGNSTASANQIATVPTALGSAGVNQVTYLPNSGYSGGDAFRFNVYDGVAYAEQDATVTLNVGAAPDTTLPSVSISLNPGTPNGDNNWYTQNVGVTVGATDASGIQSIEYSLDGGAWTAYPAGGFTVSAEGSHTVDARATDNASNVGNATQSSFKIDKTGPSASLAVTAGTAGTNGWYTSNVTISTSGSDAISGGVTCTAAQSQNTDTAGTTFNGSCTNAAGLTTNAAPLTVKVDKTEPQVSITAPAAGSYKSSDLPALAYNVTEANAYTTTEFGYSNAEGTHTVTVLATDAAGNEGSASRTYTVDNTAPSVSANPQGGLYNSSKSVMLSSPDATASIYYTLDGSAPSASSTAYAAAISISSTTTLKFIAIDPAGNSSAVVSERYTIDMVAPTTTIDTKPAALTNDATPNFSFLANETATFECKLDAGAWAACTSPRELSGLTDGSHTFSVRATDTAGNLGVEVSHTWTQDTQAPSVPKVDLVVSSDTGGSNTDNITSDNTPTFAITAEPGSTVTVYNGSTLLGTATETDTAGLFTFTGATELPDGSYLITAKATDAAGNPSVARSTPLELEIVDMTVDTRAPNVPSLDLVEASDSGSSSTDNVTNDDTPTFSGDAENGSVVKVYDGTTLLGTVTAGSTGWSFTAATLADGVHQITANATDVAGNPSDASTALSVRIDTVAPTAPSAGFDRAPEYNDWFKDTVTVSYSGSTDTGGSGVASFSASQIFSTTGTDTYSGTATDVAGNPSAVTSGSVKVDASAPGFRCEDAPTTWSRNDISISCTASDSGSGLSSASPFSLITSVAANTETDSASTGSSTVRDNVGHEVTAGPITGLKVDKKAPAINAGSASGIAGNDGWYTSAVTQGFIASDGGSGLAAGQDASFSKSSGTAEGSAVRIASGAVSDAVGNTNSGINSAAYKIDLTKPVIEDAGFVSGTAGTNGWYVSAVTNRFTASDATSGLADADQASFTKSSGTAEGSAVKISSGTVSDAAGNTASAIESAAYKIDMTAPVISGADVANTTWRNTNLSQAFTASDVTSGLVASADASFTLTASAESTRNQMGQVVPTTVAKLVLDNAGNSSQRSISAFIDKTAPSPQCGSADDNWHAANVSIACTPTDALSGVVAADQNFNLSTSVAAGSETANALTDSREIRDVAGNPATAGPIGGNKIDRKAPGIQFTNCPASVTLGSTVSANWTASDTGSGLSTAASGSEALNTSSIGSKTANASAEDNVGHTGSVSCNYNVVYGRDGGILQPINPDNSSVFSRGRAVPVKFRLAGDGAGTAFQNGFDTTGWTIQRIQVSCTNLSEVLVPENVESLASTTAFRYDATADQYIYNASFSDKAAGTCWYVKVTLNDGTSLSSAYFKLQK